MTCEIGQAVRLIPLSCHMQHIDALLIFGIDICARSYQHIDHHWVTVIRRIVQWCEASA